MIKVIYWVIVALDLLGLLLFLLLGLAAAGSSRTSPLLVVLYMLVLPGLLLGASIIVFLQSSSALWRGLAFALAAAPLAILATSQLLSRAQFAANSNDAGELTFFRAGPAREMVEAIRRNDAAAVTTLAPQVDINATGMSDMTLLISALRQLRITPDRHEVLAALLAAGADPNAGTEYEQPLEMAAQIADTTGPEPVRLLLGAGADPNRLGSSNRPIWFTALGRASSVAVLQLFLEHGADLKATGPNGETGLIYAASSSNWPAALALLERGADWKQGRSFNGSTFVELVDAHVQGRTSRAHFDSAPVEDDGVDAVVAFLNTNGGTR
jgi:hypothetical protein